MAAAAYTTDLTLIHACDAASASWTEPTGFADGAITLPETDYFIQNTGCLSKNMGAGASAVSGAIYNAGAGLTIPSGSAVMMWLYFGAPNALATQANGGLRVFVGSGTAAFKQWYVKGSNTYTYGGWFCVPVDPNTTQDATSGSPTATLQYFGAAAVLSGAGAVSKGNPFGIDILRYGRCEARINGGDLANGYATFAGFATQNDAIANRWGLLQAIDGGYLMQGLLVLGYTSAVDFRDSNRNIQIANTEKVASTFNRIEIRNASSRVDWTNVNITALGTVSRGNFEVVDDCDVNFASCVFTDMGTFIFKASSTVDTSTFRRCGQITANNAIFNQCRFESTYATAAVSATSTSAFNGCTFISDGSSYAIDLGNITSTQSMDWDITLSGYAASDGTTGNEALRVDVASGQTLTLNVGTGYSTPSVHKTGTGSVVIVSGSVTATLTVVTAAGTAISGARTLVKAAAGGSLPVNVTVTITNSGTTATVTHTAHAMATGDKVVISGASLAANNGVFAITKITNDSYSYTMGSTPGSNPTGTIKATYVLLSGTTDGNGQISMSRSFATNQPVTGWARKSTSAPYYKQGAVSGTVNTGTGASLSAVLVADE
jgi:hypothetical protein